MPTNMLRKFETICEILNRHQNDPSRLIPILREIQEEYRYLPEEALTFVATSLNIPAARVYGVASFYAHFALKPKGKHIIKICDGTACHVKGSTGLLMALRKRLNLTEGKHTSEDMMFTVETVSCLGACGLAPAIVIDEKIHGMVTPEQAVELLDEIVAKETDNENE